MYVIYMYVYLHTYTRVYIVLTQYDKKWSVANYDYTQNEQNEFVNRENAGL